MSSTVLYMSMSLDGFIGGPNESLDNPLGDGGDRLHEWPFPGADDGANRQIYDEFMSTGALVAGRGTFEPAGGWGGDHHDGVPIYILSRNPAPSPTFATASAAEGTGEATCTVTNQMRPWPDPLTLGDKPVSLVDLTRARMPNEGR
jgi:dihydrofolate reductase